MKCRDCRFINYFTSEDKYWCHPKQALKIAETFSQLGFNVHLLGSEKYVLSKLQSLSKMEIQSIKEAFIKHSHTRFMKYFSVTFPSEKSKLTLKK